MRPMDAKFRCLIVWLICACAGVANAVNPNYPNSPRRAAVDTLHGVQVREDYRWLEDTDSVEVRAWVAAQNARTRRHIDALPMRLAVKRELRGMLGGGRVERREFQFAGGRLFAMKSQPPRNQPMLVRLDASADTARERVLVDPNRIDASGKTTIDWFRPSLDGKLLAVSISMNGSEDGTLHLFDADTGRQLPDRVPRVQYPTGGGSVAWAADGRGFFYTRYPQGNERPATDANFYQQVYFHRLGTPVTQDEYVIGRDFPRIAEIFLSGSDDGRWVLAAVANGDGGEVAFHLRGSDGRWTRLADFDEGFRKAEFGRDGRLYALALKGSPRGRIVALPLDRLDGGLASARLVVPESAEVIEGFLPTDTRLYVETMAGGPTQLRMHALDGRLLAPLDAQAVASVRLGSSLGGDTLLFGSQSPVRAFAWYRYDPATADARPVKTRLSDPPVYAVDGGLPDTEVLREFAVSKDGTRVPMTVLRRKGAALDGQQPVLLTGYGGYGISLRPRFSPFSAYWLRHGGVYVQANLRGGGEFGEEWHRAGNLLNKQNVFDDFIACAEKLVSLGYTSPARLAIQGGSNGGLLMGAVMVQRPELFRAAVSEVGIYDMLRVELTPNGAFNVTEFGTVQDAAQFKALHDYSPLHHVRDGQAYPAVLLTTGEHDGRVAPWMSFKMAARLQAANPAGRPVLLRVASDVGHGAGTSLAAGLEEDADIFAFLFAQLGMR